MYQPLPKNLTLGESEIHDIGLFAKTDIKRNYQCGVSHIQVGEELYRTPLGGFINHANEPNCVKAELRMTSEDMKGHAYSYKKWNLITSQDIKEGEELTVRYTFYNV